MKQRKAIDFRSRNPLPLLLVAALALAAPQATQADPGDFLVPLPPAYNQLRPELPNGGGTHCGPTATAIALKWLNDNGFPEVGPALGVGAWDDTCVESTLAIFVLGFRMVWLPGRGVTIEHMRDAIQEILEDAYPSQFDVGYFGRHAGDPILKSIGRQFFWITNFLHAGNLVIANIGWYDPTEFFHPGKRCGGHYVAITGYDLDEEGKYWVRFRDPIHRDYACDVVDSDSSNDCVPEDDGLGCVERWETSLEDTWLQSADGDCVNEHVSVSRWHYQRPTPSLNKYYCGLPICLERKAFQDGFVYIGGMRLFSEPPTGGGLLSFDLATQEYGLHPGAVPERPTSVEVDPWKFKVYSCAPGSNQIYTTNLLTDAVGIFQTNAVLSRPRRLAFGSNGTLYVLDDGPSANPSILAIDPGGQLIGQVTPQEQPSDIAYNEKLDRVYAWSGALGQLQAYTPTLTPIGPPVSIPTGIPYAPPGHLAVDPTGDVLYCNHRGSPEIFRFDLSATSPIPMPSISDPELVDPADMVLNNQGHLFVAQGDSSPVLEYDRWGVRVKGSAAYGFNAKTVLAITRSSRRPLLDPDEDNPHNRNIDSYDAPEVLLRARF